MKPKRKRKMSDTRAKQLQERIDDLNSLIGRESQSEKPSQIYIDDLKDSIAGCQRELKFYKKNPNGVEFVNGV